MCGVLTAVKWNRSMQSMDRLNLLSSQLWLERLLTWRWTKRRENKIVFLLTFKRQDQYGPKRQPGDTSQMFQSAGHQQEVGGAVPDFTRSGWEDGEAAAAAAETCQGRESRPASCKCHGKEKHNHLAHLLSAETRRGIRQLGMNSTHLARVLFYS